MATEPVSRGISVLLNAGTVLPVGFDERRSWGGVLMHELGHLVGAGHSQDSADMMYPEATPGPAAWGAGDARVLRAAGERLGCPGLRPTS